MFEDMARNLEIPQALDMVPVLVVPAAGADHGAEDWELAGNSEPHIDHVTDDLPDFVKRIVVPVRG
jgi:putative hydrolase of the HAD superfamily